VTPTDFPARSCATPSPESVQDEGAMAMIIIALVVFSVGAVLAFNYAHMADRAANRSRKQRSWYVTSAGWRWDGALLIALSWVLAGLGLMTGSGEGVRRIGLFSIIVGGSAAIVLITYGTVAFLRYRA
jgi:hypothetical protein